MKNFFNILLIVLLTVLFMNLLSGGNVKKEGLDVSFSSREYTVPASVVVKVSNNSSEKVTLDTCKDIIIRKSGTEINLENKNICKNIEVESGQTYDINYSDNYKNFSETGKYSMEANFSGKKFTSDTEITHKGAFSKLFITFIYEPIYNLFIGLINIFNHSLGWAIIAITIIVRIILIWPQHKSMVSQRKLQQLQPEIKKIQEQYKGNQQMLGMKILELYKKEKVNPFGSLGFLFIQLPILLVLYNVILSINDYSNTYYLYDFLKNFSISSIDKNFYGLDLFGTGGTQGLILALIVGIIQFFQIKLSIMFSSPETKSENVVIEKKAGSDEYSQMMPNQDTMNKFMLYVFPIMIFFITYFFFAGVGIYFGITTLFMLVQQAIVNKMLKKSS